MFFCGNQNNKRSAANIKYITSLPVIFAAKYYADALWKVATERKIEVQLKHRLIEVRPQENVAVFESVDKPHDQIRLEVYVIISIYLILKSNRYSKIQYALLHVAPPQEPAAMLKENQHLTNDAGFMDVHRHTLQHNRYPNVFAIGDCASTPNPKTMAAAG